MPYIGQTVNEYGTEVGEYECDVCGSYFTVCPAPKTWRSVCQTPECDSYDPNSDIDSLFGDQTGFLKWCDCKGIDPAHAASHLPKGEPNRDYAGVAQG